MGLTDKIKRQYSGTRRTWCLYWKLYGGWSAIISSVYLLGALLFTILCAPLWAKGYDNFAWFNLSNSVLPSILGFTLGGYAILLAFGNSSFMKTIAGQDEEENGKPSPFMEINSTFLHFIVVQVIALIFSVFSLAWDLRIGVIAFIGFFLFSYAITSALAAAFAILRITDWYDKFIAAIRDNDKDSDF